MQCHIMQIYNIVYMVEEIWKSIHKHRTVTTVQIQDKSDRRGRGIGRSNHHLNFNSKKPIIFETQLQNSSIIFMIVNHSHKSLYIYYLCNLIFLNSINNSFRKYLNFFYFNILIVFFCTIINFSKVFLY